MANKNAVIQELIFNKRFIIVYIGYFYVIFKTWCHSFTMQNFELSPDGRLLAVCGRFGKIHLLAVNTLEGVGLLKMNSEVSAIAFDNDGSHLFSHGGRVFYLQYRMLNYILSCYMQFNMIVKMFNICCRR
jgi:WD40 repeat protein